MKPSYSFSFSQDQQKTIGKKNLSPLIMASPQKGKKPLALTEEKILNVFREQKISGFNFKDTNLTCQSQG